MAKAAKVAQGNTRSVRSAPAKATLSVAVDNTLPSIGAGGALATRLYNSVMSEGSTMRGYFVSIIGLNTNEDRADFRKTLNAAKKLASATDKTAGTKMVRTAFVRISEAMTVSKAADKMMTIQNVVDAWNEKKIGEAKTADNIAHAWIVEYARAWVNMRNAEGSLVKNDPGAKTGPKTMTPAEKIRAYILRNFGVKDFKSCAKVADEIAATIRSEKQRLAAIAPAAKTPSVKAANVS